MKILDRELCWEKDDRTNIFKLGNAALQKLAANTCVGCIDLSLNSLSQCAEKFPSDPVTCDNSWFCQPLFENNNVRFSKIGKKVKRYKLEVFKLEEYGLFGQNTTSISELFQSGSVVNQDRMSSLLMEKNFPKPEPTWKLTENHFLVLSNRLKQLTGYGKTKNGLPICFPDTAPLINPSPPRYSFSTLHEFLLNPTYRPNNLRARITRISMDWEAQAKRWNKTLATDSITGEKMQELYKLVSKSSLPPETKESWLRLLQRKTLFGSQIKHVPSLRSQIPEACSYCYRSGLLPPPLETIQHFLSRECPVVDENISVISRLIHNPEDEEHYENSCPFLGPQSSAFNEIYIFTICSLLGMRYLKEFNLKILIQNLYTLSKVGSKTSRGSKQQEFAMIALNIAAKCGSLVRPPEDFPMLALIRTSDV